MNIISDEKFDLALNLFSEGKSIREVARMVEIAKGTAHSIYTAYRQVREDENEHISPKRKGGYWDHKKHRDKTGPKLG